MGKGMLIRTTPDIKVFNQKPAGQIHCCVRPAGSFCFGFRGLRQVKHLALYQACCFYNTGTNQSLPLQNSKRKKQIHK